MQIAFTVDEQASEAIARIGRTEDVLFSPAGDRLAVAGFSANRLLILGIAADLESDSPSVALTSPIEVESDALNAPHGLSWIDDRTLAVANRKGRLAIFELPDQSKAGRINLSPVRILGDDASDLLKTPGSVSAASVGLDLVELLVCNNYVKYVSRHILDRRNGHALVASETLIRDGLDVPDGVMHSPSRRWIAISNHGCESVFLFRNDHDLGPDSAPDGVLRGVNYPHGLRFAADERSILVADAGAPFVHVYRSDGDWRGEREPDESLRVVSEESFKRGSNRPDEGGPKGLDITRDGRLMVISCEEEPFSFFDVGEQLGQREAAAPDTIGEAESAREALLRFFASERSRIEEATDAIRRASELELALIRTSNSVRVTAPLRWARSTLRKAVPRKRKSRAPQSVR